MVKNEQWTWVFCYCSWKSPLLWAERPQLIVNSVWLEIFVVSFFDWSISGKYGFRLVHWKCRVFCKVDESEVGSLAEGFWLVSVCHVSCVQLLIGVGEMLHDLIGSCWTKSEFAFVFDKGDSNQTRNTQNVHKMATAKSCAARNTRMWRKWCSYVARYWQLKEVYEAQFSKNVNSKVMGILDSCVCGDRWL